MGRNAVWGRSAAGVLWDFEEGILDMGLLVVLFDELRRGDSFWKDRPWRGSGHLGCAGRLVDSLCAMPMATGELGWAVPGVPGPQAPRGLGPVVVRWPGLTTQKRRLLECR